MIAVILYVLSLRLLGIFVLAVDLHHTMLRTLCCPFVSSSHRYWISEHSVHDSLALVSQLHVASTEAS